MTTIEELRAEFDARNALFVEQFARIDQRLADTNAQLDALHLTLTRLAAEERMLADRTEQTRTNLTERMDVLERFIGQTIGHIQDHRADPEAHDPENNS